MTISPEHLCGHAKTQAFSSSNEGPGRGLHSKCGVSVWLWLLDGSRCARP